MFTLNNVIEIRKKYMSVIESLNVNVYFEDPPPDDESVGYPYVVLDLPDSDFDGANSEMFEFYVQGWDESFNTTNIEDMMFKINNAINGIVYQIDSTLSFRSELDNKKNINDSDNRFKRREYRYLIRSIQRRA